MAISNNGQQYQNTHNFIDLNQLQGSGEVGRYKDDVVGVLLGIEPRDGFYQVQDRKTGVMIQRPNSWTAHFADGSMFSWPTYLDETSGRVMPWSRFDQSINLAACAQQGIAIHIWRDERKFVHLEIAEQQQVQTNLNPLPIMNGQQVAQQQVAQPQPAMPATAPWDMQ